MQWAALWFGGAGGTVVLAVLNYLVGPWAKARRRRERFFDLAFGHDGTDGLPETKNIFTRVGNVEHVVTHSALLNGEGELLVADVKRLAAGFAGFSTEAADAKRLAGEAAAKAAALAKDVRHVQRGVNAIRAELDTYAKVVSRDTAELWTALREAGVGRRADDEGTTK